MKKIALILILPLVLSLVAVAAQKKDASKKSTESATSEQHVVLNPADLKWGDAPPGLPPGAKLAVLAGDPNKKGLFTMRLQTPAGYKIPPHTHPTSEHITVFPAHLTLAREIRSMKQLEKRWVLAAMWSIRRG
jgi:quercetin dioxygenase-like cupin family protein